MGKCPWWGIVHGGELSDGELSGGEMSMVGNYPWWGNVRGGEMSGGEMSVGNCPGGELSVVGKCPVGKCPGGEMSGHREMYTLAIIFFLSTHLRLVTEYTYNASFIKKKR